jgi:tRNA pseudouridine38-40 synthase
MPRYALAVEYDGTDFLGWQIQPHGITLQQTLQEAVSFVVNENIEVVASGRTDTGVHASGQVIHFDCAVERTARSLMLGITSRLPDSMAVRWAGKIEDDFHARFCAVRRYYRYQILNRAIRPGLHSRTHAWERLPLDELAMHSAAQQLLGEHDFTSFRTVHCQARTPTRVLHQLDVQRHGDVVTFDVCANAFLHHMVRNLVGTLTCIGRGEQPVAWAHEILMARNRAIAGPTAPAGGLIFLGPKYPNRFSLPAEFTQ